MSDKYPPRVLPSHRPGQPSEVAQEMAIADSHYENGYRAGREAGRLEARSELEAQLRAADALAQAVWNFNTSTKIAVAHEAYEEAKSGEGT